MKNNNVKIGVEKALKECKCRFKEWCWRLVYTAACREEPYPLGEAPERFTILCAGGLNGFANIFPRGGVYCKNLPYFDGSNHINDCPSYVGKPYNSCPEYKYEENLQRRKEAKGNPRNLSHNVRRIRGKIDSKIVRSIYGEFKYSCAYCGININQRTSDGKKVVMTIDHRVPLNMGGTDEYSNLVLACRTCNSIKKDQIWEVSSRK